MSATKVIHHIDYRSKAEDRKRELEKLQEKRLAKTQAAQLKGASVPREACNFLEKQRELFVARRKNRADAIEFLHQFRADDDFVLRTTRRSLGSKSDRIYFSPCRNLAPISKPGQGQRPDARASIYSYAVYPILPPKEIVNMKKHDAYSNESLSKLIDLPDINENPICFESTFEALEIAAKEASRFPLPDGDIENGEIENLGTAIDTPHPSEDHMDRESRIHNIVSHDVNKGDKNEGNICATSGSHLDVAPQASIPTSNDNKSCSDSNNNDETAAVTDDEKCNSLLILEGEVDDVTTPFIPYEAFSKLGESLSVESYYINPSRDSGVQTNVKDESDSESDIPREAFLQLGASIMANDLVTLKDDNGEEKKLEKDLSQHMRENPELIPTSTTDLQYAQFSNDSKSPSVSVKIEELRSDHTVNKKIDESSKSDYDDAISGIKTDTGDESPILVRKYYKGTTEQCEQKDIPRPHDILPRKIDGDCLMLQSKEHCDNVRTQKSTERFIDTEAAVGDTNYEIGTPKISHSRVGQISGDKGELQESENNPPMKTRIVDRNSIDAAPRSSRRTRKKKKDNSYYPSSGLFVSRQFLSR